VVGAAAIPIVALAAVFPGQGTMPFPALDFVAEGTIFVVAALFIPGHERTLRIGAGLYVAAFVAEFVLPSALGGNIDRLGETLGLPLAVCLLWPARRVVLTALAVPLILINWGPAWSAVANRTNPSAKSQFFAPVVAFVQAHDNPLGRVEIVPTAAPGRLRTPPRPYRWRGDGSASSTPPTTRSSTREGRSRRRPTDPGSWTTGCASSPSRM